MSTVYYHLGTTMIKLPNQTVHDMLERAVNKALAEREAQAVQREREAAKGLVEVLEKLASHCDTSVLGGQIFIGETWIKHNVLPVLATYNDNRKG